MYLPDSIRDNRHWKVLSSSEKTPNDDVGAYNTEGVETFSIVSGVTLVVKYN